MPETEDKKKRAKGELIHAVIDRIEDGSMAVLLLDDDEKTQIDIPVRLLPDGARDGDHLRITIKTDSASRAGATERIKKLQEQLSRSGDVQGEQKDYKL